MLLLGCGYLGTALARTALIGGETVSALTRSEERAAALRALGLPKVVVGDIASDDWHAQLNPAGESIVNSVAPATPGAEGYRHSFVEGAKSITRWLEQSAAAGQAPAREFVFTSSTSVYPQTDGGWVDENTPVDPPTLGPAGALLREAEDLLLALPPRLVRRVWILRLAGLYGPSRHHLLDALRAGESHFPGDGAQWLNLLHRDDAVGAIRACLGAMADIHGGIFNVTDDSPAPKRELVLWLARQLGRNPTQINFDAAVSTRSHHRKNAAGKVPHRRMANGKIKAALPWRAQFPSYREGYAGLLSSSA
ncbi:MAG TPA: NAD-dependent epimerase/dehydratase family protein [Opitutales bacterium]|nr:NAD-dependent epimerase/dehydratase family protein [Opitutales bacterium]